MLTVYEQKRKPLVNPLTSYRKKVRARKSQALPTQTLGFGTPKFTPECWQSSISNASHPSNHPGQRSKRHSFTRGNHRLVHVLEVRALAPLL
jgi:hypothetical protein